MTKKDLKTRLAAFALVLSFGIAATTTAQSGGFRTRCGWFENPTPGNYSLYDRDAEWLFGVQGGYQLEDFEMPEFKRNEWVETPSGSYGYGCACFEMRVDFMTNHVLGIRRSFARSLAACRKDKALKRKWNFDL